MGARKVKTEKNAVEPKAKSPEMPGQGLLGLRDWLELHQNQLISAVAGVLVIALVVWGVNSYLERTERNAQAEYAAILKGWPADNGADAAVWEGLRARLEQFIAGSSGSRAALYARMDLMRVLLQQARLDEALKEASILTGKVSTEKALGPLLRYQLALTYDVAGRSDEAMAQWSALKADPLPGVEREVDWRLGRLHAARQDFARAVDLFESALKHQGEYPSTALLQQDLAAARPRVAKGS